MAELHPATAQVALEHAVLRALVRASTVHERLPERIADKLPNADKGAVRVTMDRLETEGKLYRGHLGIQLTMDGHEYLTELRRNEQRRAQR